MKAKIVAAAASAIIALNLLAAFDETNIVSQIARKAAELIQRAVGFAFGAN